MDLLDSDDGTSPDASEASDAEAPVGSSRDDLQDHVDVGKRTVLRQFSGRCVGDDMSWLGTKATRVVTLQAGGTGADRVQWGQFWGTALRDLGSDIGVVAETRLWKDEDHIAACKGMWAAGYTAISHGASAHEAGDTQFASGVLLAIKNTYVGAWADVERDIDGRGLAGTITTSEGEMVTVVGVYSVSGASLPGFESQAGRVRAEQRLTEFVLQQRDKAEMQGCLFILAGDVNSVACVAADTWGGTYVSRMTCLAHVMQEEGLEDTFRMRHTRLRGFTYFTITGTSASRLDSVWIYKPAGMVVQVLNAAVLWGWEKRADHEPALVDLLFTLPAVEGQASMEPARPWKDLIGRMGGAELSSLVTQVQDAVSIQRRRFDLAEVELRQLQRSCAPRELFGSEWEGLDGFNLAGARGDGRSVQMRHRLGSHFSAFQKLIYECLPAPANTGRKAVWRVYDAWSECVGMLRVLRNNLTASAMSGVGLPPVASLDLSRLQTAWGRGAALLRSLNGQRRIVVEETVSGDWDGFVSDRIGWASRLGLPESARAAAAAPEETARVDDPWTPPQAPSWPDEQPHLGNRGQYLALSAVWLEAATKARGICRRHVGTDSLASRVDALRRNDFRTWARRMRPAVAPSPGYMPAQVCDAMGNARIPRTQEEVKVGAVQEWSRLLCEPRQQWRSQTVDEWKDSLGNRRGQPALGRFVTALPGTDLERVGHVYLLRRCSTCPPSSLS